MWIRVRQPRHPASSCESGQPHVRPRPSRTADRATSSRRILRRARAPKCRSTSVILTTSTSEAYSFVFRTLCNPGDEILIPEPSYPLFAFLADIQDVKLVRYPLDYDYGWQINFHALQQAITARTRGVIVVHPNNPTGHFTKPHELEKLNEICVAAQSGHHRRRSVSGFRAARCTRRSAFAQNSAALTFTMSGLSKISGLPQMKAAWLITSGPEQLKSQALCAPGNHRGHLSLDERAGSTRHPRAARRSAISFKRNCWPASEKIWPNWIVNWRRRSPARGWQ